MLNIGLLCLILPLGWPLLAAIGFAVAAARGSDDLGREMTYAAVIAAVPCLLVWRFLGRRARPLPDGSGIAVLGYTRMYRVPWSQLDEIESTEGTSGRNNFAFSHTAVSFREGAPGRQRRRVVVSMSWRSGSAGVFRICTWAPPNHPVRRFLPRGWREATAVPEIDYEGREAVWGAPVIGTLRPSQSVRTTQLVLAAALMIAAAVGALRFAAKDGAGWTTLSIGLWAGIPLLGVLAWRAWQARIEMTPVGLRVHGLGTCYYSRAEIAGFVLAAEQFRLYTRVVLAGQGSRALAATAGGGGETDGSIQRLERWLTTDGRETG